MGNRLLAKFLLLLSIIIIVVQVGKLACITCLSVRGFIFLVLFDDKLMVVGDDCAWVARENRAIDLSSDMSCGVSEECEACQEVMISSWHRLVHSPRDHRYYSSDMFNAHYPCLCHWSAFCVPFSDSDQYVWLRKIIFCRKSEHSIRKELITANDGRRWSTKECVI